MLVGGPLYCFLGEPDILKKTLIQLLTYMPDHAILSMSKDETPSHGGQQIMKLNIFPLDPSNLEKGLVVYQNARKRTRIVITPSSPGPGAFDLPYTWNEHLYGYMDIKPPYERLYSKPQCEGQKVTSLVSSADSQGRNLPETIQDALYCLFGKSPKLAVIEYHLSVSQAAKDFMGIVEHPVFFPLNPVTTKGV